MSFYKKAFAKTQTPPADPGLNLICQKKAGDKYVSFIGFGNNKVSIAAFTAEKPNNIQEKIFLKMKFTEAVPSEPFAGEITDWGYVFDRNADGKIDYMAFLVGALPVKQKDFPPDFPKSDQMMKLDQLKFFYRSHQLVFAHSADDNYDGRIDGMVFEAMDTERNWVDRWMVFLSSKYDDIIDNCWYFEESIEEKSGECLFLNELFKQGYATQRKGLIDPVVGTWKLYELSDMLSELNRAAAMCESGAAFNDQRN
ncbi:MAG: hypothetical protein AB1632_12560 [Nitrospirota bacterium]